MPLNTGSYVLSSEDTTSPFSNSPQTAIPTPQPSYHQHPERTHAQSIQPPYNQQPTGPISQYAQQQKQHQQNNDYPPSYATSHPAPYPNMQSEYGGESISHQPMPHPSPVAEEGKKPLFTDETKEKGKFLCRECGSSAVCVCGGLMLFFGFMCGFCGALFS